MAKHKAEHLFVYVRGNLGNPCGVVNRLVEMGGVITRPFRAVELANPHNIFYIDFHDKNAIKYISDDSIFFDTISGTWSELTPLSLQLEDPISWDDALVRFYEAQSYDGKNPEIYDFGKLIVLRDIYRKGWEPDEESSFYYIANNNGVIDRFKGNAKRRVLSFQTPELRDTFYANFLDLIESVKDLI